MKIIHFISLSFFLSFLQLSYSQNDKKLVVDYNEVIAQNRQKIIKKVGKLFVSRDYSLYKVQFDKVEDKDDFEEGVINVSPNGKFIDFSEIIIDKKGKKLTERLYENLFLKKYYSVYENKPEMNWVMLAGEKKINSYNCKKAQTTFRGRTYIVWYTEKIPISSGPWKFNGLPGLILSVEDKEGIYKWEAKTIVYPSKGKDVDFNKLTKENSKFKSISYKDFDKKRIDAIKEKIKIIKSRNVNRGGMGVGYEYSTYLEKEPINEWRTEKDFH